MLKKSYQIIEDIIATDEASFIDVLVELFDLIFQKQNLRSHREALFLRAVLSYDRWEIPEKVQKHMFTSTIANPLYATDFGQELAVAFIKRFQNLKEFYSNRETPTMAARAVFNLIDELNEGKFTLFRLFFMSGFFPYQSNIWIAVEDATIDDQQSEKCEEVRNLLHRACWALENNEALFLNYTMNLLDAYKDDPAIRFAILQQFGVYMKYRGTAEMQDMVHLVRDEVADSSGWDSLPQISRYRKN